MWWREFELAKEARKTAQRRHQAAFGITILYSVTRGNLTTETTGPSTVDGIKCRQEGFVRCEAVVPVGDRCDRK